MCIMEIHKGQMTSTMVQAMAHNASTLDRDLDMLESVLAHRGDEATLHRVIGAHSQIASAYQVLLSAYGQAIGDQEVDDRGHVHQHGNERVHPA